jgi:hypothetical protein
MQLKKGQLPILIVHGIALIIFTIIFISRKNYEFLGYIGVIVAAMLLILFTNHKVDYPNSVLWGLTLWSVMHMSGGGLFINGKKLYEIVLLNIVGEPYYILKYDQLVHVIGFGVATLLMYTLIKPLLKKDHGWVALFIVVVMSGLGVGALNEVIEFIVTVAAPQSGVGGYINNALDLVADLIGALLALVVIYFKEKKGGL